MFSSKAPASNGRHANPKTEELPQTTLGRYWDSLRHQARTAFSDEPPEEEGLLAPPPDQGYLEGIGEVFQLSYKEKLLGFLLSLGMGIGCIALAISFAPMVALFPKKFAFFITMGNALCAGSTIFLVGISYQIKFMFVANRFEAACIYIFTLLGTLISAVWLKSSVLCIAFAIAQIAAILWYCLSFIPFARQTIGWAFGYLTVLLRPVLSLVGTLLGQCASLVLG